MPNTYLDSLSCCKTKSKSMSVWSLSTMATQPCGKHCSVVVGSRFIYVIRTNRLETTENKTLKVDFLGMFGGHRSLRGVHAELRYNSCQQCIDRVHTGQKPPKWAHLIFLEQTAATQTPAKWGWHHDIRSHKYLLCDSSDLRQQTDSTISWQDSAVTAPALHCQVAWLCFPFLQESGDCATIRGVSGPYYFIFAASWLYSVSPACAEVWRK